MKLTPKKVLAALKAAAFRAVDATVSKGESWQRMQICASCPELRSPENLEEEAAILLSGGEHVCGVCGCGVNLLIVTKDELLEDHPEDEEYRPDHCWFPKK